MPPASPSGEYSDKLDFTDPSVVETLELRTVPWQLLSYHTDLTLTDNIRLERERESLNSQTRHLIKEAIANYAIAVSKEAVDTFVDNSMLGLVANVNTPVGVRKFPIGKVSNSESEPKRDKDIRSSPNRALWKEVTIRGPDGLKASNTLSLTIIPANLKALSAEWIFQR